MSNSVTQTSSISKRPTETKFHQQKLDAWKPELSMASMYITFLVFGIVYFLIGVILLVTTLGLVESQNDYTDCINPSTNTTCSSELNINYTSQFQACICIVSFKLTKLMSPPIFLYYKLDNFNQNHRRFVKSRDTSQLLGNTISASSLSSDCDPYRVSLDKLPYAPCGLIANSLFNDSFSLFQDKPDGSLEIKMSNKNIAWKIEYDLLYGKPQSFNNTVKPINWPNSAYNRTPDAYKDEELIVWMRTSPLLNFRKLHRIILHEESGLKQGLPSGNYIMNINYSYPVAEFNGRKSFVLTNTNALGGRNYILSILFIIVGVIQISLGIVFKLVPLFKRSPKVGPHNLERYIRNNMERLKNPPRPTFIHKHFM